MYETEPTWHLNQGKKKKKLKKNEGRNKREADEKKELRDTDPLLRHPLVLTDSQNQFESTCGIK